MKILIIEDERLLADTIKSMLERKGLQVELFRQRESSREYAELGIYDLLIPRQHRYFCSTGGDLTFSIQNGIV